MSHLSAVQYIKMREARKIWIDFDNNAFKLKIELYENSASRWPAKLHSNRKTTKDVDNLLVSAEITAVHDIKLTLKYYALKHTN